MNPVKEIRESKDLSLNDLAEFIDSNSLTLRKVEKGKCLSTTYLTIIRKMNLEFNEIDDGKLIKEYENWLKDNDITVR